MKVSSIQTKLPNDCGKLEKKLTLKNASENSVVTDSNDAETPTYVVQDLIVGITNLTFQNEIYFEADEQGDYVTADLMTQLSKWCEFNSWFLASIVGEDAESNIYRAHFIDICVNFLKNLLFRLKGNRS